MEGHLRDYEIEHLDNFLFWTSTRDHSPNCEVIPVSTSKSQWSLYLLLRNWELGRDQPAFYITTIPRWDCLNCRKQLEYPIIWYLSSEGTMIKAYCSLWVQRDSNCSKVSVGMEGRGKMDTLLYIALLSNLILRLNNFWKQCNLFGLSFATRGHNHFFPLK